MTTPYRLAAAELTQQRHSAAEEVSDLLLAARVHGGSSELLALIRRRGQTITHELTALVALCHRLDSHYQARRP